MPESVGAQPFEMPQSVDLPPAGYLRDEELRRRTDTLGEQQDRDGVDQWRFDPRALDVDNDLAAHFNELAVTNEQPGFVYCWTYTGASGSAVNRKLAQRVLYQGAVTPTWCVVQGDDPECPELKGRFGALDTTRRLGDVLLMRCRVELKMLLDRIQEQKTQAQLGAGESELREIAAKYGGNLLTTHDNLDNPAMARTVQRMHNMAAGSRLAFQRVNNHLRAGTMPGMPAPGR